MLLQYAREHHFPNPTFFVDDGVSGVTYDRPGFQAMLAEIEAGRVAVAIAKDLSRLGRNSALTGLYTNFTFPQNGVRFIAINDNYDTIDPNRVDNDFAGIKNWFNEFYARDTSRKIRAVQKAKGERGVPLTTNVPYRNDRTKTLRSSFRRRTSMWASISWTATLCGNWCPPSMWTHRTNPAGSVCSTFTSSTMGWASSR